MGILNDINGYIEQRGTAEQELEVNAKSLKTAKPDTSVASTLAERGARYGDFNTHACITQNLKDVMRGTEGWDKLTPAMKESLEMNAHKIGRILNGDPFYADSWHDIAGYAELVDNILSREV